MLGFQKSATPNFGTTHLGFIKIGKTFALMCASNVGTERAIQEVFVRTKDESLMLDPV